MQPAQVHLVQETFEYIVPFAESAGMLFYRRLFALDPNLRALFQDDIHHQANKLMDALSYVVRGLHTPDKIMPRVREMGQRHVAYGVRPEHYTSVGAALLWTLEQGMEERWSSEVATAWAAAYALVVMEMLEGASKAEIEAVRATVAEAA